jgi:hypothetical protein
MASVISAAEWEILGFFSVEPEPQDKGVPWPYNDFCYTVSQGLYVLSCAIAPAYKDVRIILSHAGVRTYELNAVNVYDVRVSKRNTDEVLEIEIRAGELVTLRIWPTIEVTHSASNEP